MFRQNITNVKCFRYGKGNHKANNSYKVKNLFCKYCSTKGDVESVCIIRQNETGSFNSPTAKRYCTYYKTPTTNAFNVTSLDTKDKNTKKIHTKVYQESDCTKYFIDNYK